MPGASPGVTFHCPRKDQGDSLVGRVLTKSVQGITRTGWKKPATGGEKRRDGKPVEANEENKDTRCEVAKPAKDPPPKDT